VTDDNDLADPDPDRVVRDHPKRDDLVSLDHAMAEVAQVPRLLLPGPAQDIGRIADNEAHPLDPCHPAAPHSAVARN
jgi:hypothetical protein